MQAPTQTHHSGDATCMGLSAIEHTHTPCEIVSSRGGGSACTASHASSAETTATATPKHRSTRLHYSFRRASQHTHLLKQGQLVRRPQHGRASHASGALDAQHTIPLNYIFSLALHQCLVALHFIHIPLETGPARAAEAAWRCARRTPAAPARRGAGASRSAAPQRAPLPATAGPPLKLNLNLKLKSKLK
jgi:hypothetical protein